MPPKRAGTRRAGATARSDVSIILGHSSPSVMNTPRPDVPTQPSWAYGSPAPAVLPRQVMAKQMGLTEVAESMDQTIREAQKRDQHNHPDESSEDGGRPHMNTRLRGRSMAANQSPVRRRTKREPTPDQMQLLQALREATVSPNRGNRGNQEDQMERSTATPTPPIPHTLSTVSSPSSQLLTNPNYPSLPVGQLYPSPLQRVGSPTRNDMPLENSTQNADIDDNESVISWMVERDVHDDDLQRTSSARYRNEPQGRNITAPPRRFSGLAFANETIHEEDEPDSRLSVSQARSREHTVESQARSEPRSDPKRSLEPQQQQPEPEVFTAPARTIIPQSFTREASKEISFQDSTAPLPEQSFTDQARSIPKANFIPRFSFRYPGKQALRIIGLVVLFTLSLFTLYSFSEELVDLSRTIISHSPFYKPTPFIPLNTSDYEVVNKLNSQMVKLGAQVSSMSQELRTIKSEVHGVAAPTSVFEPIRTLPQKPNFLNINMGVIVDPRMTSPTVVTAGDKRDHPDDPRPEENGPLAALLPWDDNGDCWCSAPRNGISQLALHLARGIVPEDVVVEHIPKHAAITPETAPKDMELWVRYTVDSHAESNLPSETGSARWYSRRLTELLNSLSPKSEGFEKEYQSPMLAGRFSLHDYLMGVLRPAYSREPETAYWNDTLLGPSFYRVSKWRYNIHGAHHIQENSLDVIIDQPDIRVDQVVFRVKSNWGANYTCLYRLKLYGHL